MSDDADEFALLGALVEKLRTEKKQLEDQLRLATGTDSKVLILPLRWQMKGEREAILFAGQITLGEVFQVYNPLEWWARGHVIISHRSNGHASMKAAQEALETVAMALTAG